jgi:hypothetical protein
LKLPKIYASCLIASSVLLLAGCAVEHDSTGFSGLGATYQSNVKPQADGSYYVEAEASLAAGRTTGAKGVVTDQAREFCTKQNKSLKVIDLSVDSHLLVNGVARMRFSCE